MSTENHEWRIGAEAPLIRPHSVTKHRVFQQYLTRYVGTLTADLRIPKLRLTLVDGFAGGGAYRDEWTKEHRDGSPLLMLKAMRDAAMEAQEKRSKEFQLDAEYFFIEAKKCAFEYLEMTLKKSEFGPLLDSNVTLLNDTFEKQVDRLLKHARAKGAKHRTIFVLDQFGWKDVPFAALRRIFATLENAEVILTFATDWLVNFLSGEDKMQSTLERVGLRFPVDEIEAAKQAPTWRGLIETNLSHQVHHGSGARYFTPFFIRSKDAHCDHWLIHLSMHSRARDVMTELHWAEGTSFEHFGGPGLMMLGYNQDEDPNCTGARSLFPEYRFDKFANNTTHAALVAQLPERVSRHPAGIDFRGFFASVANETPATAEQLKVALAEIHRAGLIEVRDKTGTVHRQNGVQHHSDIVIPSPQRRFLFD